jgi:MinD-like ATPase involved in chromosome partitioning or flagellar assembly
VAKANNKVSASKHPEAVPADSKKNDPAGGTPEVGDSASVAAQEPAEHDSVLDESQVDPSALIGDDVDSHSVIVTASVAAQTQREDNPSGTPEASYMLTEDRLLDQKKTAEVPEGFFQRLLYELSFHLINVGDSRAARARKDLSSRIARPFDGGAMYVPVLTRKGGVGKTTVTTLLGMALAEVRDDRVIAIDANPDRGTLSERVPRSTAATVRDVVKLIAGIRGFTDFSELVSKDKTRLHVLASDTDPQLSEAFDEDDYNVVADAAARFYSVILTDCGTGVVHSVMKPTLERADGLVVVSGGSIDEARLASETLTWLEANGWGDLVRNTIVVLNTATQGTNVVKLEEIEDHFLSRVRDVVRIPYDPMLAAGSIIEWDRLSPFTRLAARELAALVVEGVADQSGR